MKIGVLTSGGDAPGMNAAIRAVVRTAIELGFEVYGIRNGYKGVVDGDYIKMDKYSVSDIINRGGTILGSARLPEFADEAVRRQGVEKLKAAGIDAIVVIGGDGSFRGAKALTDMGVNCVGLPGTIDNDIASTDYTIGFFTALNTVIEAIDKIRDTSSSHNRCSIVEIMGRDCGDLSIFAGIATGCEYVITSETGLDKDALMASLSRDKANGKKHAIIALAEKIIDAQELAHEIKARVGYESRATVLGHIQRGGSPAAFDRILASQMGNYAVNLLSQSVGGVVVALKDNKLQHFAIDDALKMKKEKSSLYNIFNTLK